MIAVIVRAVWVVIGILLALSVCLAAGVPWFFNRLSPLVDAKRRSADDNYFFSMCRSGMMTRFRWFNRRLPASPRCRFCLVPFGGMGRLLRIRPSRKNPNFCMGCFEMAPLGAHDMEVGVLFADIRGFTSWCEGQTAKSAEQALNSFYAVSSEVLTERDAVVDKLVGDEVMALFLTAFPSLESNACEIMVRSAQELLRRLQLIEPVLPVGIGLNYGLARVGNVGSGTVKDFTAVGDTVNTAARLQACAQAGEIIMAEAVYERVKNQHPLTAPIQLSLKGKSKRVSAHRLAASDDPVVRSDVQSRG